VDLAHGLSGESVSVRAGDEEVRVAELMPAAHVEGGDAVAEGSGGTPGHDVNVVLPG